MPLRRYTREMRRRSPAYQKSMAAKLSAVHAEDAQFAGDLAAEAGGAERSADVCHARADALRQPTLELRPRDLHEAAQVEDRPEAGGDEVRALDDRHPRGGRTADAGRRRLGLVRAGPDRASGCLVDLNLSHAAVPSCGKLGRGRARRQSGRMRSLMPEIRKTVCNRDCPDACSVVAHIEDGRVVALGGAPSHPVTNGFLCWRTNNFLPLQYSPERLTSPLLRGKPVSWDEALDFAARELLRIRAESGPAAIFHYRSGGGPGGPEDPPQHILQEL